MWDDRASMVPSPAMAELNAIRADDRSTEPPAEDLGALPLPPSFRGARRAGRRAGDVRRGRRRPRRIPAGRCTSTRCRSRSWRPTRPWWRSWRRRSTSTRSGRRSSSRSRPSGSSQRLGKESVWGARHDQPFHVMGSDAAGVVLRVGSAVRQLEAGRRGHRALQLRRRPGPDARTTTRCSPPTSGSGASRRTTAVSAELTRGEGEPADAQAGAPHVGGGGGQRAHQLHQLPDDREPERRADDPGPDRAGLGRERGASVPTRASTSCNGGGTPVGVVSSPERAALLHDDGGRARDRPQGRGLPVLERRARRRTRPSGAASGSGSASWSARDPDIVFEHPGRSDHGGVGVRVPARRASSSPARRRAGS